jgi:O-antigen ligase
MRLVLYFVFFAAALTFLNTEKRIRNVAILLIGFGALLAFFGILQRLENPDGIYGLRVTPQAIPFGPYVNQHHFAALMEMTGGLAVGLLFSGGFDRYKRLFLMMAATVMGIAVVFTGSRGGLLSFSGMIVFVILGSLLSARSPDRGGSGSGIARMRIALAAGGLGLVSLILGLVVFLGGGESLMRGTGIQAVAGDVTSGRSHFWQIAWKIFLDNPLIGAGLDAFGVAFTKYDTTNGFLRVEQAHNDYLQILSDAGILGFACVAAFIYLLFSQSIRTISRAGSVFGRSASIGSLAGCFAILVHSFFDFPLRTPANAYFFLTLVAIATIPAAATRSRRHKSSADT